MLPDGWKNATLGDLVSLQRGYDLTVNEREEGTIPVMGGGGQNGTHSTSNVKSPGVVIGRSGSGFGNAFYCQKDFWAHNTVMFVKDFKGNDVKFVFYVLDFLDFSKHNSGGAQPSLNRNFIYPISLSIPPLEEQHKIALMLSTCDMAIEELGELIQQKQKQKKALMQRLLTGKHRFPEFEGQEWQDIELGKILKESRIPDKQNDPRKRITVKLHLKGVTAREYKGNEAKDATAYFKRKAGQIIYGKQNLFRGSIGVVPTELDGFSSSQDIPAFDVQEGYDVEWIYHYFSRPHFYEHLEVYSSGSGSKRVQPKVLLKHKILCPNLAEQQKIAAVLNAADKEIDLLTQKLEAYQDQKKGLMQQLLTGKKRVKLHRKEAA